METNATTPTRRRSVRVDFITRDWEFSNDWRKPRGRGSWAFSLKRNPDVTIKGEIFWTPSMTYGDAKKLAREHFIALVPVDAKFPGEAFVDVWVLS